jgi:hypothetical protein
MNGPIATLALVLAETAAGCAALLWLGGGWGAVKRGFFVLTGATTLTFALMATLAAASATPARAGDAARTAVVLASVTSAVLGLSLAGLVLRANLAGRAFGILAIAGSVATLVALAALASASFPSALAQLLAGAAFMGAVMDGLLLGHWYLVDRGLAREHIRRFAAVLIGAVVVEALAVAILGFGSSEPGAAAGFSPLLGISGLATWLALGMVACTALIAVLIRASLKGTRARAVQAATGFFYLAVITAFTAEMAAKVGFLR